MPMNYLCIPVLAGVPQHFELILDQVAALGYVLRGFHLVSSQHPYLNPCPNHIPYCLWYSILQPIEHCSCSQQAQVSLKVVDKWFHGLLLVLKRQLIDFLLKLLILLSRDYPHCDKKRS